MNMTFPVTCHTDNVGEGSTFVAIPGMREDGALHIPLAVQKGARTIVVQQDRPVSQELISTLSLQNVTLQYVDNARAALATLSSQAFNNPAEKLKIIGVTGTKGKSTTCFLVEHILSRCGMKTALLSSVYNKINDTVLKTSLTTAQPDYLHAFFNECVHAGVEYVVMEVAAQALTLHRVDGIMFDGIIFTNFDQEHGEFYQSMDDYFKAKCTIFLHAKPGAPLVVNADDDWCKKIESHPHLYTFGFDHDATYQAGMHISGTATEIVFTQDDAVFVCTSLIGTFNAYNLLASIVLLKQLGYADSSIQKGLATFVGVPGRMECYILPNGARAYIDKAHNPSSFKAVLSTVRSLANHVVVVFGAGGNRDKVKRPIMGALAVAYADRVILTNDDPRSEDPQAIVDDILAGISPAGRSKVLCQLDRELAIKHAYSLSKSDSIIVLLGKGSEHYQIIGDIKYPFNEQEILKIL
jgi:UDP-N-acetylmuramoyl-L-alanyl-D-glutamate--2,6-diaminopimelate ligase